MLNDLEKFIHDNQSEIFVTGGISEKEVEDLEKKLNIKFRTEIKDYLLKYGIIIGYGIEILGCGNNGISSLVRETKRFKEYGLDNDFIVIRNSDEWIYCFNNNDGTITSWDRNEKNHIKKSDSLYAYILSELLEAKEVWE